MPIQKGQVPAKISNNPVPLNVREGQYQRETGNKYAFTIDMGGKMPNIQHATTQSGKEGSINPVTVKPLRTPIAEPEASNPDHNFHDQFVKVNEFEHTPGVNNV